MKNKFSRGIKSISLCIYLTVFAFVSPVITFAQQNKLITGRITDEYDEPVIGANIVEKGSQNGVISDMNGNFSLHIAPNSTLIITYIGYKTQEVKTGNKEFFEIILSEEFNTLDEVVAIGYGVKKKANLTGSTTTINAAELTLRTTPNVENMLQGKIPGLQIVQSSGAPGDDNAMTRIRGTGTFSSAGNDPLILVDGVQGSLSNLNPEDIETISVLKDAASAAIYGSRAANGVILVTTKQGGTGFNIEYKGSIQVQQPTRMPDLVTNSADFMESWNFARKRNGEPGFFTAEEIDLFRNSTDRIKYPNFNWMDHMIQNGLSHTHHLSINGGTEKTKYNVSFGYLDQEGIVKQNNGLNYQRENVMLNLTTKLNHIFTLGTNVNMKYQNRNQPVSGAEEMILLIYSAGPNYMPKLPDGSNRWTWRYSAGPWHNRNPEAVFDYGNRNKKKYSVAAQAYMDVNILKDLVWTTKVAVNYDDQFDKNVEHGVPLYFYNDYTLAGAETPYEIGVRNRMENNILVTVFSTVNYTKSFTGGHNINVMGGYSQEKNSFRYLDGKKISFPSDAFTELKPGSSEGQSVTGNLEEWAMRSWFGRINYDYQGKYLLEANLRYDGTSRIYKDNRWGAFPSFSGGWRISQENFMKDYNWLDNLKLRASWGKLGNQNIGLYPYQDVYDTSYNYSYDNSVEQGVALTRLTDKNLKWETTKVIDIGVDASFKRGLFSVAFDWYNKTTDDILYQIEIPASIGLAPPTTNYAKMRNKGFEIELGHLYKIKEFTYSVNFNLSRNRNEVLRISSPTYGTTTIQEGLPWKSYYLVEWTGIFQSEEEINNAPKHPYGPQPGDLKFKDQNNDNVIDEKDRVVVDGAHPKFYYGGSVNLQWKNFDLNAFFQGVQGQKFFVNEYGADPFIQGIAPTKEFWKNSWTPENQSNTYPAMYAHGYGPVTGTPSTYHLQNASYCRLKNLTIGYTIPRALCSKIGMKNIRVYFSGDNLATITKYPYADPERTGSGMFVSYPQLRSFTFGLNVQY